MHQCVKQHLTAGTLCLVMPSDMPSDVIIHDPWHFPLDRICLGLCFQLLHERLPNLIVTFVDVMSVWWHRTHTHFPLCPIMQYTDICSPILKWDYNDKIISDLKSEGRFRLKAHCVSSLFRVWKALTSNYGHVMPVDWKQSRSCSLNIPTFNPEEKRVSGTTIQSLSHFPFETPPNLSYLLISQISDIDCAWL